MVNQRMLSRQVSLAFAGLLGSTFLLPGMVSAQNSTATLRGHITAPQGQVPTQVVATNTATGFVNKAKVTTDGNYTLAGLAPGSYTIVASGSNASQTVSVQVGQSLTLNLDATGPAGAPANATNLTGVTVSAVALVETRTSEVATNVTRKQIETLPQNERNFLDFAKLVPGVIMSRDPNSKTFSAGGQSAENVNVFIDGASLGNPGPAGVGAFFVDTQGHPLLRLYKYLGETTNNVAEYLALVYALYEARNRGWSRIAVKTDSELLACQLNGQYKVRDETLRVLHDVAATFQQAFATCTIEHVPREQNTQADRLAGEAVKSRRDRSLVVRPS